MGNALAKRSPLERQNSVLRRSQRRSMSSLSSRIEKIAKRIKKLKSTEKDDEYNDIKNKIIVIDMEFHKRNAIVQPELRNVYNLTELKIKQTIEALDKKMEENALKLKSSRDPDTEMEVTSIDVIPETANTENNNLSSPIKNGKRMSVEFRAIKLENNDLSRDSASTVDSNRISNATKSPDTTRRSIMKYGIQVMPKYVEEQFLRTVKFDLNQDEDVVASNIRSSFMSSFKPAAKQIEEIKENIANIEIRINEFVGKKDGKHYKALREPLVRYLDELNDIQEIELEDEVIRCKKFIRSCFYFLDERAVNVDDSDDDIFLNNYKDPTIYGSTHDLLAGHAVKTTAI